ncbi:MAG: DUF934 domain-containing protein [Halomonadaceae bacterium]|nr:MAG: DUF934 domain-containing protein [Halomonadaceae bacterium]
MQPNVVTLDGVVQDSWTLLDMPGEGDTLSLPDSQVIVPLKWFLEHRHEVLNADPEGRRIGVWFDSDDEPERLGNDCQILPLIAVNFPKFTDGRGYSIARLLRERFGFTGELRAIGDVLLDQLHYMKRCGFSSFALRADKDINKAPAALSAFSDAHQAAVDQTAPLFRRRA